MKSKKIVITVCSLFIIVFVILVLSYFSLLPFDLFSKNLIPEYLTLSQKVVNSESDSYKVKVDAETFLISLEKRETISNIDNVGFLGVENRNNGIVVLSSSNDRYYKITESGLIEDVSSEYNKKVSSNDNSLLAVIEESVLTGDEPGILSSGMRVVDMDNKTVKEINPSEYSEDYFDVEPLIFSEDNEWIYLQLWGPRGGDFSDKMMVVKQSILDNEKEIILQNPDPQPEKYFDEVYFSISHIDYMNKRIIVNKIFTKDNDLEKTELWQIDVNTGNFEKISGPFDGFPRIIFNNENTKIMVVEENKFSIVNLSSNNIEKTDNNLPSGCNVEAISKNADFVALSCYEGNKENIKIMNLENGKLKDIATNIIDDSRYSQGAETIIFLGFVE